MREDTNIKAADSESDLWLDYLLCGPGAQDEAPAHFRCFFSQL